MPTPGGGDAAILPVMPSLISVESLSQGQRAFAHTVHARPLALVAALPEAAFVYGRENGRPARWLVDADGQVLEHDTFSAARPR